jgi:hypothetical protein
MLSIAVCVCVFLTINAKEKTHKENSYQTVHISAFFLRKCPMTYRYIFTFKVQINDVQGTAFYFGLTGAHLTPTSYETWTTLPRMSKKACSTKCSVKNTAFWHVAQRSSVYWIPNHTASSIKKHNIENLNSQNKYISYCMTLKTKALRSFNTPRTIYPTTRFNIA